MTVAVIRFPGSNCDQDAYYAVREDLGLSAEYVWHDSESLKGFDAVFVPGGFSYGDYLRCGAMAAQSPIMKAVKKFAEDGKPVIGACNGFQVLCEANLLPGALVRNVHEKFICTDVFLKAETNRSVWTQGVNKVLRIPIAHGEGRYVISEDGLAELTENHQIAFRYVNPQGELSETANVNGSTASIAGVLNKQGNVLGLMPHPERATKSVLGYEDGHQILQCLKLVGAR